jgi:hypothetical protein
MMPNMTMNLGEGEPAPGRGKSCRWPGSSACSVLATAHRLGGPGSWPWTGGKTTLAERIWGAVPASTVVHTDDVAWSQAMFDWTDLLIGGVLEPVHRGEPVSFRPPAWRERNRAGAVEVPQGCELLIVEGAGAARRELMDLADAVVWVQSDMAEAERRGIDRDGGDAAAVSFWHLWMAEELPFMARQRPWTRATVIAAGTPSVPHDPANEVVVAEAVSRSSAP